MGKPTAVEQKQVGPGVHLRTGVGGFAAERDELHGLHDRAGGGALEVTDRISS